MRVFLVVLVTLLAAGGLLFAFRGPPAHSPEVDLPEEPRAAPEPLVEEVIRRTVGTLAVRVQTEAGEVPPGAEVGFEALHRQSWAPAGSEGMRNFTNVPVGIVYAMARAPGYESMRQRRELPPGLADEAVLVLRRAPSLTEPPR